MVPSRFAGMVDPQICKILLAEIGLSTDEINTVLPKLLARIGEVYPTLEKTLALNVGVRELLQILANSPRHVTGVLTGNLRAVAMEKLTSTHIRHYFSEFFCADDYIDRVTLVQNAVETCVAKHGLKDDEDVLIVGDTPRDIEAANASNATSIGVASGVYTIAQLSHAGAKQVHKNLEPTQELLAGLRLTQ
jgi:phosphoglycolate phosphatase-like HAD superfamily hydrolase